MSVYGIYYLIEDKIQSRTKIYVHSISSGAFGSDLTPRASRTIESEILKILFRFLSLE